MRNRPTSRNFGLTKLSLCLSLAWAAAPALAQNAAPAPTAASSQAQALKSVVVTATRSAAADPTASSITRQQLNRNLPSDDSDLFKNEPDIAFAKDLSRHGASRINIRGIEDNRVVSMIDGVRLGDYYSEAIDHSNISTSQAPAAMPDFLKRVEIMRGANSSLYGSGAIGGVVSYVTLDPADLLSDGATSGFQLRGAYTGANSGFSQTALGAWRAENVDLLLGYSQASNRQQGNMGNIDGPPSERTKTNKIKSHNQGLLAKLVWQASKDDQLSFMLEGRQQKTDTNTLRWASWEPAVAALHGQDNMQRQRLSLDWKHSAATPLYDRLSAHLYHQRSKTTNYDFDHLTNTANNCSPYAGAGDNDCDVETDFSFQQTSIGANLKFEKALKMSRADHLLSYGFDFNRDRVESLRQAQAWLWNQVAGVRTPSKKYDGYDYPLRDFPINTTDKFSLFVQDEISNLAGGKLSVTPSLRYDHIKLTPQIDALAQQALSNTGGKSEEKSHNAWSPKLGLAWHFDQVLSAYAQLASGFRAPNYSESGRAVFNPMAHGGIALIANPNLKPETSLGLELGVRFNNDQLRGQFSVFDNRYHNFIHSTKLDCPSNSACAPNARSTYQTLNIERARIYGIEARTSWDFAPGWSVGGALAWAHGSNQESGKPLDTVEPLRLSANLARDFGIWGVSGQLRAAKRKDDIDHIGFKPGGYSVVDMSAWWKISRQASLTLALNNVFNKKYWLWGDIRRGDAKNQEADFYSQPGRSINLAVQIDF